jgi:hypothetical protein
MAFAIFTGYSVIPGSDQSAAYFFISIKIHYSIQPMDEDGFYLGELNGIRGLVPSNLLQPAADENSSINGT